MAARVAGLFIYPIKSAAGTAVTELELDEFGPVHDRHWMIVDRHNRFITQREIAALALIHPVVVHDGLRLEAAHRPSLFVSRPPDNSETRQVIVWKDTVPATDAGNEAAAWCAEIVGEECRLVHIAPNARRPLALKYAGPLNAEGRYVTFNDGAPLMMLSEASITELNERLLGKGVATVGVDRFRPNILLAETGAHEEDTWLTIRIGQVTMGMGSQCQRCVMTTVNQQLGKRAPARPDEPGGEPLRSLATYRRIGAEVMFGMNATHAAPGTIRIGDAVTVLEERQ